MLSWNLGALVLWCFGALALLACLAAALYFFIRRRKSELSKTSASVSPDEKTPYQISYVPSDIEWSGSTTGVIPLKTLTYKQYECLEDARYGFRIVGVKPTERKNEQSHKTRTHGQKTVASLVRHGFLISNGADSLVITDHGLNALEVCDVRY